MHCVHAAPPIPQLPLLVPGWHPLDEQQPVGQEIASHTHAPETQRRPLLQAGALPQVHAPAAEQRSAVVESHATQVPPPTPQLAAEMVLQAPFAQQPLGHDVALHTHVPLTQVVPGPHAGPVPQRHAPLTASQALAAGSAQAAQAAPPVPQALADGGLHTPPAQQPLGHDCALHTHAPATQALPLAQARLEPQRHSPDTEQLSAWS